MPIDELPADRGLSNQARRPLQGQILRRVVSFGKNSSGATVIMAALLMPILALGMGLGAETGYQYMTQRQLQHAADLSAHAGGIRLRAGDGKATIDAAVLQVATASGFAVADGTIIVNTPPAAGPNTGNASSVEVLLTKTQVRYFSAIIIDEPILIGARAVASVVASGSTACVLALSPTKSRAITVSGATDVSLVGCDIASNSNAADAFWMDSSLAKLTVECVHTVGEAITNSTLRLLDCAEPNEYAPVVRDPYADVAEPSTAVPCVADKNVTVFEPTFAHPSGVLAMKICGGLDVKKQVTFKPGLYIIEGGDLTLNANATVAIDSAGMTADGVTFYLTGTARLKLTGNGSLNLQAPTSGPFAGILVFGSRSQVGVAHEILGNSNSTTQGAIYAPTSAISFSGNSTTTNGCTQVIGFTVEFTGKSMLRSNCTVGNVREIQTNVSVRIVE